MNRPNHGGQRAALLILPLLLAAAMALAEPRTKTETFDKDPDWEGLNNRMAKDENAREVRQSFGYSATNQAGGKAVGEMGGHIAQSGEPSYYGKIIEPRTLNEKLSASGTFSVAEGAAHLLLGFFNADTANEWRTPNTIVLRISNRGTYFYAFVEYCTSKWRAADNDKSFGKEIPTGQPHTWSLAYDPNGNGGAGAITATIDDMTVTCDLEKGHKADGATFNRFGMLNVIRSADQGSEAWFDDITIDDQTESFDHDPEWDGRDNQISYRSTLVRPLFDFGYSSKTHLAGGKAKGELGGVVFRGNCRNEREIACYGDRVGLLKLDKPIKASGKISMSRAVSESSTLFGFYHSQSSMAHSEAQDDLIPESCLGAHVESRIREGFVLHPLFRAAGGKSGDGRPQGSAPHILPDGAKHDWTLEYDPNGAGGKGQITISLDGEKTTLELPEGANQSQTEFDRFGIVTTWIDGQSQSIYLDDITYTVDQ